MSTDAPATDVGQPTILDGDGAHHALILQTMAEGVVVQDRDGAIRSCNPGAERILGLTADQMTGRTSLDPRWRAVREDGSDFPGPEHPAMVTLATGQGLRDVIMGVHVPDGALRWISISTEPFIRGDGVLDGVVCSFTDITAVRLAELCARESAERLSAVLRVPAEVGIVGTDAAGLITLFSAGAERMLGYSAAELIGRHTPMLFHDPVELAARAANLGIDEPGLAVVTSATRAGRAETREWTHVRKNGDRFIASVNVSAIRSADDAIVGFVGMLIDVTEARCVERQRDAQARESASLRRVATAVARGQRPVEIFSLVAREAAELLGFAAGGVVRFDDDRRHGCVVGSWALDGLPTPATGTVLPLGPANASGLVGMTGLPSRIQAYDMDDAVNAAIIPEAPYRSGIAAPIFVDGDLWGAVSAAALDGPIPAAEEERLAQFAELVALAVSAADARTQLEALAATDHLTAVGNRRSFDEGIAVEMARARRSGNALSVVILDIDHFKAVNDRFGHECGDAVLRAVASGIAATGRRGETIARIGGEEFGWIFPETAVDGARAAAERARSAIGRMELPGVGRVTISAGVADSTGIQDGDEDELVRRADAALYEAKHAGRDRVVVWSAREPDSSSPDRRPDERDVQLVTTEP